jgi:hypothetical protein
MTSVSALDRLLSLPAVMEAVGEPLRSPALPAACRCHSCSGRMHIYEDSITGGHWHYCFGCKAKGDLLELAAARWGLSVESAARKLHNLGLLRSLDKLPSYLARALGRRQICEEFWEGCRKRLAGARSPGVTTLRRRLRVESQHSGGRWLDGPGMLLGSSHRKEILRVFTPKGVAYNSGFCVLTGGGWTDVLVARFESLPGRACGFLLAGRECRPQSDFAYRPATMKYGPTLTEAGLAGLWAYDNAAELFGGHVFAVRCPFLAARLQIRHSNSSLKPLPLVAYHDSGRFVTGRDAWQCVANRRAVLWCWRLTPDALHQAVLCDGLLAVTPLEESTNKSVDHYIRLSEPRVLFGKIVRRARPWRQALARWCDQVSDSAVEDLVLGMETYRLPDGTLRGIHRTVDACLDAPRAARKVKTGAQEVVESGGCWYLSGRLYMNATLRIDRLRAEGDDHHYVGRINYQGQEIPFDLPVRQLMREPHYALQKVVADACGGALILSECDVVSVVNTALLFNTPDVTLAR